MTRRFRVRVRDASGRTLAMERESESRSSLVAELRRSRFVVLDAAEIRRASPFTLGALHPMTGFNVETGLRQLASMLRGGVTLLAALETVIGESPHERARRVWGRVRDGVLAGRTFADSLASSSGAFGGVVLSLVAVGERSGELVAVLARAADHLEDRRNLRACVVHALAYPLIALGATVAVSSYLVTVVIPKMAEFLKSGGARLPALTMMLMDISAWASANLGNLLFAAAAAFAALHVVRRTDVGRLATDALLLRLPVVGRILKLSATSLFARALETMVVSGVTLAEALSSSSSLMSNRAARSQVECARSRVLAGETLAAALRDASAFLPMLSRMVAVGEAGGSLPETLGETARYHERALAQAVRRLGLVLEPLMVAVTALIVGFVYLAFFLALFSLAGAAR